MSIRRGVSKLACGVLMALSLALSGTAPAHAISDGAAGLQARGRALDREGGGAVAEPYGGSLPGAVGWVVLGLGIALVIVVIGLSNAETVSE